LKGADTDNRGFFRAWLRRHAQRRETLRAANLLPNLRLFSPQRRATDMTLKNQHALDD
jgi:hypothetical protein